MRIWKLLKASGSEKQQEGASQPEPFDPMFLIGLLAIVLAVLGGAWRQSRRLA